MGAKMINARAETVMEKPAFRTAFKKRRCLIPANGFFEWKRKVSGREQPLIEISIQPVFFELPTFQFVPLQFGITREIATVRTIFIGHVVENDVSVYAHPIVVQGGYGPFETDLIAEE